MWGGEGREDQRDDLDVVPDPLGNVLEDLKSRRDEILELVPGGVVERAAVDVVPDGLFGHPGRAVALGDGQSKP